MVPEPGLSTGAVPPEGTASADPQDAGQPDPQPAYPAQSYPAQPDPGQSYPAQPYPGQSYPAQPYPGQSYPAQPIPAQPYPGQPYPGPFPASPSAQPAPPPGKRPKPPALPVVEREYHEFFRAPRFRWWKPVAAIALLVVADVVAMLTLVPLLLADVSSGRVTVEEMEAGTKTTPMLFLVNNLGLAALVPLAYLTAWAVFQQRPRWLSSVAGGFRWGLFWRFTGIAAVLISASVFLPAVLSGDGFTGLAWNDDSLFLILTILATTPLQAAGEEFALRGLGSRAIGSWFGSRRVGLVVSTAVTALVFMSLHGAGDPWLNAFYLVFAVSASVLVWRTGGLEAAVAVHVANNMLSELFLPFTPIDELFNREAGVAGPETLVQIAALLITVGLILWQARRLGVVRTAAPAAPVSVTPEEPLQEAGSGVLWNSSHNG